MGWDVSKAMEKELVVVSVTLYHWDWDVPKAMAKELIQIDFGHLFVGLLSMFFSD